MKSVVLYHIEWLYFMECGTKYMLDILNGHYMKNDFSCRKDFSLFFIRTSTYKNFSKSLLLTYEFFYGDFLNFSYYQIL